MREREYSSQPDPSSGEHAEGTAQRLRKPGDSASVLGRLGKVVLIKFLDAKVATETAQTQQHDIDSGTHGLARSQEPVGVSPGSAARRSLLFEPGLKMSSSVDSGINPSDHFAWPHPNKPGDSKELPPQSQSEQAQLHITEPDQSGVHEDTDEDLANEAHAEPEQQPDEKFLLSPQALWECLTAPEKDAKSLNFPFLVTFVFDGNKPSEEHQFLVWKGFPKKPFIYPLTSYPQESPPPAAASRLLYGLKEELKQPDHDRDQFMRTRSSRDREMGLGHVLEALNNDLDQPVEHIRVQELDEAEAKKLRNRVQSREGVKRSRQRLKADAEAGIEEAKQKRAAQSAYSSNWQHGYYQLHPEKRQERDAKYRQTHREQYNAYQRDIMRKRRWADR